MMLAERREGFVLVCVIWLLAMLTVIAIGFGRRALLDLRTAAYSLDKTQAQYLARGAVERAMVALRNKAVIDRYNEESGRTSFDQAWAKPVDMLKKSGDFSISNDPAYENEVCQYVIEDECSRISINHAPEELLREVEGLSLSALRKISARREWDSTINASQPFQSLEELRYMSGIDDEEWYGDENAPGLKDVLTCWGSSHINLNTAPEVVLRCVPDASDSALSAILRYRAGPDYELRTDDDRGFSSWDHLREELRLGAESLHTLQRYCTFNSGCFRITGFATQRRGKVKAYCSAIVFVGDGTARIVQWREGALGQ